MPLNLPKKFNFQNLVSERRIRRVVSKKFFVANMGRNPKVDVNFMPRQKIISIVRNDSCYL